MTTWWGSANEWFEAPGGMYSSAVDQDIWLEGDRAVARMHATLDAAAHTNPDEGLAFVPRRLVWPCASCGVTIEPDIEAPCPSCDAFPRICNDIQGQSNQPEPITGE